MYTRCPACGTTFAIGAEALRIGRGTARCGHCLSLFDALAELRDALPAVQPAVPGARPAGEEGPAAGAAPEAEGEAAPLLEESAAEAAADEEEIPEVLREDLARLERASRAARWRAFYGVLAALLLLALALQYAWFMPQDVLARYPQSRGWLEAFCERTGCRLPERRDLSRIVVVSRDVRVHPKYEGALLVTATLENNAPYAQPWPQLQFTLYNVNGQRIAARRFAPREYLASGAPAGAEMPPHAPVQISLELLAPEQAAVSFEFRFL